MRAGKLLKAALNKEGPMKTQKIVRFTRNFDRRHRTDVYLYANTYEDITSLIENEINDNVYGISDYPNLS